MGIKPWTHHAQIKWALPEEGSDLTAALDTARDSWTCTPEGDLKFLFWKRTVAPNTNDNVPFYFISFYIILYNKE